MDQRPVLITGATGGQGGAAVAATLAKGIATRALVRNPQSEAARTFARSGAELVVGDFADPASLTKAVKGVRGLFSVQLDSAPLHHFTALLDAALDAGVEQFIQSTAAATGRHESFPGWHAGHPAADYWLKKAAQESAVAVAPFRYRTYLRPAAIMDNLVSHAPFMYPRLASQGDVLTAVPADIPLAYISNHTIGVVVAAAFADPERFNEARIELADDFLSTTQFVKALAKATGKPVTVTSVDPDEAIALGLAPRIVTRHIWHVQYGSPARPEMLKPFGIKPLPFEKWARQHRDRIEIGPKR